MEPGRCSIHGLILAEDGKCVICRRGMSAGSDEPRKTISDPMWAVIIGGVVLIGAGAWFVYADPLATKPRTATTTPEFKPQTAAAPVEFETPAPRRTTVFVSLDPPPAASSASVDAPGDLVAPEVAGDAELQAEMRRVRIVMYSSGTDPFCQQVRTFLKKHRYAFTDYDIDKSETDRIEMKALDPSGTLPTLSVEGNVLVGFDRQEFESTVRRVAEAKLRRPKR